MKNFRLLFSLSMLAGLLVTGSALADHHRGHGGFHDDGYEHIGVYLGSPFPFFPGPYYSPYYLGSPFPFFPGPYYSPYYSYNPPLIVTPPPPAVYIERPAPSPAENNYYWYHCDQPKGYYPYVKACPGGWQKVIPSPPSH